MLHHCYDFSIGCDSTSAFSGKGKKKPWKTLLEHPELFNAFFTIGSSPVDEEMVRSLNRFVCYLYGDKVSTSVDDCRYVYFTYSIVTSDFINK